MKYYTQDPGFRIVALRDHQLKDRMIYRRLWADAMRLDPVIGSRRKWRAEAEKLDWLDGCFLFEDGSPYRLTRPAFEVFDLSNRWWSTYRQADATGRRPKHHVRAWEKLRRTHLIIEVWRIEGTYPDHRPNPPGEHRYRR